MNRYAVRFEDAGGGWATVVLAHSEASAAVEACRVFLMQAPNLAARLERSSWLSSEDCRISVEIVLEG